MRLPDKERALNFILHNNRKPALTDKVIILDLDHTLISTQDHYDLLLKFKIMSDPEHLPLRKRIYYFDLFSTDKIGRGNNDGYWGIVRPDTYEFLYFCFLYFRKVIIWSAGTRDYVHRIVQYLFRNLPSPDLILTRDDVIFNKRGDVEKPITKLMELYPDLNITLENAIFIDDTDTTFFHNKDNAIHIPKYAPGLRIEDFNEQDYVLDKIMTWLLLPEIVETQDFRETDKSEIFTERYYINKAYLFGILQRLGSTGDSSLRDLVTADARESNDFLV